MPAVKYGQLYYRDLETYKIQSLKRCMGNCHAKISLNKQTKEQLNRWIHNVVGQSKPFHIENPTFTITTDASSKAWGAHLQDQNASGI